VAGSAEVVRRSEGASRGRGRIVCVLVGLVSAWLSGSTRPAVWLRRRIDPAMQNQPVLVYSVVLVVALPASP
jgi:hypothetical protein